MAPSASSIRGLSGALDGFRGAFGGSPGSVVRAAQLERMVRGFKLGSRQDEADREKERFESRCFSVFPDEEGMCVVKGRLTPEVGALLMRAVEAASDALYREKGPKGVSYETSFEDAAHRRADALGLPADPVAALTKDTRRRGADPDFHTAGARWKREADIPGDVYLRAMEANG